MGEECNTGLGLGIGGGRDFTSNQNHVRKSPVQFHILFPPGVKEEEKEETAIEEDQIERLKVKIKDGKDKSAMNKDASNGGGNNSDGMRKKLRLTKEQSTLLEDSFRGHNTLTQAQKQELAHRLNLRPRQVEVWFQNRRARTKLKQTEVDCELLKKYCENLSNENRRLKKELQELRLMQPGSPFYMQISKVAKLSVCPSCQKIVTVEESNCLSTVVP